MCNSLGGVLKTAGKLFIALRGIDDGSNYIICIENEYLGAIAVSNANSKIAGAEEATPNVLDSLLADMAEIKSASGMSVLQANPHIRLLLNRAIRALSFSGLHPERCLEKQQLGQY